MNPAFEFVGYVDTLLSCRYMCQHPVNVAKVLELDDVYIVPTTTHVTLDWSPIVDCFIGQCADCGKRYFALPKA